LGKKSFPRSGKKKGRGPLLARGWGEKKDATTSFQAEKRKKVNHGKKSPPLFEEQRKRPCSPDADRKVTGHQVYILPRKKGEKKKMLLKGRLIHQQRRGKGGRIAFAKNEGRESNHNSFLSEGVSGEYPLKRPEGGSFRRKS